MTQVAVIVDRDPTAIQRHPSWMDGGKGLFAFGKGVVKGEGHGRSGRGVTAEGLGFAVCGFAVHLAPKT
jgi:hypothetical protein